MNNKRTLTLVLFALIAAGLWGLTDLLDSAPEDNSVGLEVARPGPAGEQSDSPPAEALAAEDADSTATEEAVPEGRRVAGAGAGLKGSESFDLEDALWLEGRVTTPGGFPADELAELLVLVFAEESPPENREASRRLKKLETEYPNAAQWQSNLSEDFSDAAWARRPVAADGSFRIPVPATGGVLRAVIDARYLYQKRVFTQELAAVAEDGAELAELPELIVEAETGAWITGKCSPPAAAADRDPGELKAQLTGIPREKSSGFRGMFSLGASFKRQDEMDAGPAFEFRGLPPELIYTISVASDELLDRAESDISVSAGEHLELPLTLALGARISGRVLDAAGDPVAEARVQVGGVMGGMMSMVSSSMSAGRVNTKSDESGRYELKGALTKPTKLSAFKQGYLLSSTEELSLAEGIVLEDVNLVLASGQRIAGSVKWPDGTPAGGARVRAESTQSPMGFSMSAMLTSRNGTGKTDDEGHFELSGLSADSFTVIASAVLPRAKADVPVEEEPELGEMSDGEVEALEQLEEMGIDLADDDEDRPRWRVKRTEVAANTLDLVLFLEEPTGVAGRVVDDLGAPLTSFSVGATLRGSSRRAWGAGSSVDGSFESEDGNFLLEGLSAGAWALEASAQGYSRQAAEVQITAPYSGPPLELVLPRAATVSGLVLDPLGAPVEGARVSARRSSSSGSGRSARSSNTEADGSFRVDSVDAGPLSFTASSDDWAASLPLTLDLTPASFMEDVVLTLRMGGTLTGEVFDANGKPEPNCSIQLISPTGQNGGDDISTDENGWFEVSHLTPGKYQVMAEPSREAIAELIGSGDEPDIGSIFSSMKMASAEVRDGETIHVVLGEEPKNPVTVTGRVTEGGQPVGGIMVAGIPEGGNILSALGLSQTREDGSYKLTLKRPGPTVFSVQAFSDSDIQFFEDVPEGESFVLDMALPLGGVSGTIYGPAGKPLAGVPVKLDQSGGVFSLSDLGNGGGSGITTDERGSYAFTHLAPGEYTLRAGGGSRGFSGRQATVGLTLRDGVQVYEDEITTDVNLTLGSAARLLGTVTDAAGKPAANASVFVYDEAGRVVSPLSTCISDSRGSFIYDGLSPGRYTLTAIQGELCSPTSAPVRVDAGVDAQVRLRLEAATTLVVQLQDRAGQAIRARVRILDSDGREVGTRMSADRLGDLLSEGYSTREQRFGPLPPGKYRVIASATDGRDANKPVTLKGQAERSVKLRLK
ncbi:MAG TPA: carboxypeptidase regulatory-like domain-containing protein [Planctomycetota bacterium]|nr:carboxypeptidase regulatory-like domain-containing protein [Planctomycetota bacterium]